MEDRHTEIFISRLKEIFKEESQTDTAEKLNTSQTNVSKWMCGTSVPTADSLYLIAKKYKVSIDWLLGLTDIKEIDGINTSLLTYEHAALVLDELLKNGNIEVPNYRQLGDYTNDGELLFGETDDEGYVVSEPEPIYDSDYIKINDLALSFILRRRIKYLEIDEDDLLYWQERVVDRFKGIRLLNYKGNAHAAISTKSWYGFKQGDWADLLKELNTMTEEDMKAMIERAKEGKEDGR